MVQQVRRAFKACRVFRGSKEYREMTVLKASKDYRVL
jgi:hypothetical protein